MFLLGYFIELVQIFSVYFIELVQLLLHSVGILWFYPKCSVGKM